MSTAKSVMFCIAIGLISVAFICGLVTEFTKDSTKNVFNWITIGCILGAGACFVAYDVLK